MVDLEIPFRKLPETIRNKLGWAEFISRYRRKKRRWRKQNQNHQESNAYTIQPPDWHCRARPARQGSCHEIRAECNLPWDGEVVRSCQWRRMWRVGMMGLSLDVKINCDLPISELLLVVLYQYNLWLRFNKNSTKKWALLVGIRKV